MYIDSQRIDVVTSCPQNERVCEIVLAGGQTYTVDLSPLEAVELIEKHLAGR